MKKLIAIILLSIGLLSIGLFVSCKQASPLEIKPPSYYSPTECPAKGDCSKCHEW